MNFILEAIRGTFIPTRLQTSLAGNYCDYPNPENSTAINEESEGTAIHEHIHYFQTVFTGFGQTAWNTHRIVTGHIVNEWIKATNNYVQQRPLPLAYLASKEIKDKALALFLYKTVMESLKPLTARHAIKDPSLKLSDLAININSHPWHINPIIECRGEKIYLQGKDVLENHAQNMEAIYSFLINKIPFIKSYDWDVLPKRYYFLYSWFLSNVGHERILEFPIICDLALQAIPEMVINTEEEWRKSSPSWRFVRLTEALKNLKILDFIRKPQDIINYYSTYCDHLLNYCGYDSLEKIFQMRQRSLRSLGEQSIMEQTMDQALDFRREHPWCGANPFLDTSIWIEMKNRFPPLLIQTEDGLRVTLLPADRRQVLVKEFIMELQIQALAAQIMGDLSIDDKSRGAVKCGFKYFNIPHGCHYQTEKSCCGILNPKEGAPFPLVIHQDEFEGCWFEATLNLYGTAISNIDVRYGYKMPTMEELLKEFDEKSEIEKKEEAL